MLLALWQVALKRNPKMHRPHGQLGLLTHSNIKRLSWFPDCPLNVPETPTSLSTTNLLAHINVAAEGNILSPACCWFTEKTPVYF